jgi:phage tail sheath protein FI
MPATYTYPGVYVEEVPSGVRPIVGVSTAETAFVDFLPRGPVDEATRITSLGDFQRIFGGPDRRSEASYAVRQYYVNGGQVAWVVRANTGGGTSSIPLDDPSAALTLTVQAASPGAWGDTLRVAVVVDPATPDAFDLFAREVVQVGTQEQVVNSEDFRNLSMDPANPRYAADLVNGDSALVRLVDAGTGEVPDGAAPTSSGGAPDTAFQALNGGNDGPMFDAAGVLTDIAGFATALAGDETAKTGLRALDRIEPFIFNILCLPATARLDAANATTLLTEAETYCLDHRAFLIVDIPSNVNDVAEMVTWIEANSGLRHTNAAVYFPRLRVSDPLNEGRLRDVGPSGTMAGIYARTDGARGVWKAPAGTDAALRGAELVVRLNDDENGGLNPIGVNVLRNFPIHGTVAWGARTLMGADRQASEWKYIPVRRTALFIEESLYQGLKWVVFEPNDEPLWAQIRLNVGSFMQGLFRQGAFQGGTPREAYFVKCDKETTTEADIDRGIVNILVGFAPLKPAEFVVIRIQQMAGQTQS